MAQITLNVTDTYTGDAIHATTPPTFCKPELDPERAFSGCAATPSKWPSASILLETKLKAHELIAD